MEPSRSSANSVERLSRYRGGEIRKYPRCKTEVQRMLCCRWRDHRDSSAAHRWVGDYVRLAGKIAEGYGGHGVPLDELIGEGHVGLMRAVCSFDPDRGVGFTAYATCCVREAIHEYILRTKRMTLRQMALFCTASKACASAGN